MKGRNNQSVAASVTMSKYVYLVERDTPATTNKVCSEVCVCQCVQAFVFPEQTEGAGDTLASVCNLFGAGEGAGVFPFPLDHDCGQACAS